MSDTTENTTTATLPIRPCPFCGSEDLLVSVHDRYGVQCACGASLQPSHRTLVEALIRWNKRSGGAAAAGGRATKGLCSRRKLAAAKRNLKKARYARLVIRLKVKTAAAIAQLRPYREAEQLRLEGSAGGCRSRLAALLPQVTAS